MKKLVNLTLGLILAAFLFSLGSGEAEGSSPPRWEPVPMPALSELPWEYDHYVRRGEYLFMLAGYYYNDARKWNWIYETNIDKIKKPNRIYPGQRLTIRLPRDWEPPMPYSVWYDRNKDQYFMYAKKGIPKGLTPLSVLQPASGY